MRTQFVEEQLFCVIYINFFDEKEIYYRKKVTKTRISMYEKNCLTHSYISLVQQAPYTIVLQISSFHNSSQ